jgi:hypothetical protein
MKIYLVVVPACLCSEAQYECSAALQMSSSFLLLKCNFPKALDDATDIISNDTTFHVHIVPSFIFTARAATSSSSLPRSHHLSQTSHHADDCRTPEADREIRRCSCKVRR